jgi:ankyrin repeat protein
MTALHHALSSLPKTLDETYSRILNNVDEDDRPAIRRIFQWLCFSRRPLSKEEIGTIYLLAEPFEFPFNTEQDLFQPDGILDTCRGLFILKHIPGGSFGSRCHDDPTVVHKTVQLAHFSVKEYLISQRSLHWRLDELESHLSIIKASTAYFMYAAASEDAKALDVIDLIHAYPLADYAAEYSCKHLDVLNPREHPDLLGSFQQLFDPRSWARLGCLLNNLHMIYATSTDLRYMRHIMCASYSEFPTRGFAAWSLISATKLGLVETMNWLLSFECVQSEINTSFPPHYSGPPIREASASGHGKSVLILLNASANPNSGRYPALHIASRNGHAWIVGRLIDAGADVNLRDRSGITALFEATNSGHVQVMQMLVDSGAQLDRGRKRWNSPLCAASDMGNPAALQLLLRRGSIAYRRCVYRSALCVAIGKVNDEAIRMLLDVGLAEMDSKEHQDGYALQAASMNGDKDTLEGLIGSGADVNAKGGYFCSALCAATLRGRADIVQILLDAGADANRQYSSASESTPLQIATANESPEIVSMLIATGANIDEERGMMNGCALQIASLRGFKEIVHILLQGGADVNHSGGRYGSSLQAACTGGDGYEHWDSAVQDYEGTILLLLIAGADVNQQGGKYGSALRAALAWNNVDIAYLLLDAGAIPVDEKDVPSCVWEWAKHPWDDESDCDDASDDSDEYNSD